MTQPKGPRENGARARLGTECPIVPTKEYLPYLGLSEIRWNDSVIRKFICKTKNDISNISLPIFLSLSYIFTNILISNAFPPLLFQLQLFLHSFIEISVLLSLPFCPMPPPQTVFLHREQEAMRPYHLRRPMFVSSLVDAAPARALKASHLFSLTDTLISLCNSLRSL